MLYDALHERILKKGYQVKYVSVHQPGQNLKYVPVYRSPSGEEVFEDEATVEGIAIVEVPGTEPSRIERERAIAKLIDILVAETSPSCDWPQLKHAIKAMAQEADLKLHVGKLLAETLPHEISEAYAKYVVSFLEESALKEANRAADEVTGISEQLRPPD